MSVDLNTERPIMVEEVALLLPAFDEPGDVPFERQTLDSRIPSWTERCFDDEP